MTISNIACNPCISLRWPPLGVVVSVSTDILDIQRTPSYLSKENAYHLRFVNIIVRHKLSENMKFEQFSELLSVQAICCLW